MGAREVLFRLSALGCIAAGAYHVVGVFVPAWLEPAPRSRHALFVLLNAALAVALVRRPRYLVYPFLALVVQQVISHTQRARDIWSVEKRVDWSSAAAIGGVTFIFILLVLDEREKGRAAARAGAP